MLNYLIINNISTLDMDILVMKHPPIIRAERETSEIRIPGRDGSLHEEMELKNYTKSVELLMQDTSRLQEFLTLIEGNLEVVFSSEPNHMYRCRVKNQIDLAKVLEDRRQFILQLDTYPLKYSANPLDDEIALTAGGKIYNKGTYYSEPIIEIHGNGSVAININGEDFVVGSIDGHVTINSEIQEVYWGEYSWNNQFLADDFPKLKVGENEISWNGNVEKIRIKPNWRWL